VITKPKDQQTLNSEERGVNSGHLELALHSLQQKCDELMGQKHILEEKLAQKQVSLCGFECNNG
jgi:hypothetical protein